MNHAAATAPRRVLKQTTSLCRVCRRAVPAEVAEEDGRIGSVCIYEAEDQDAIREHGRRVGAPSEDFQVVRGAVVKRPDPQTAQSG